MCDWNNNGRYDMQDAFISYHINKSMSSNTEYEPSSSSAGGVMTVIAVVLLVLGVLILFA